MQVEKRMMLEALVVFDEKLMGTKNLPLNVYFSPLTLFSYFPDQKNGNKNGRRIETMIA